MKKINKKGFEISINMIIIIIIAVVTLFVALGFITGMIPELFKLIKFPEVDQATADDPIRFNPAVMQRGSRTGMSVSFYNAEDADIPNTVLPSISCVGISGIIVDVHGLNVPLDEVRKYEPIVTIPRTTQVGQYSCLLTISNTEETFILDVTK